MTRTQDPPAKIPPLSTSAPGGNRFLVNEMWFEFMSHQTRQDGAWLIKKKDELGAQHWILML